MQRNYSKQKILLINTFHKLTEKNLVFEVVQILKQNGNITKIKCYIKMEEN